jgi:hypothetical protein
VPAGQTTDLVRHNRLGCGQNNAFCEKSVSLSNILTNQPWTGLHKCNYSDKFLCGVFAGLRLLVQQDKDKRISHHITHIAASSHTSTLINTHRCPSEAMTVSLHTEHSITTVIAAPADSHHVFIVAS